MLSCKCVFEKFPKSHACVDSVLFSHQFKCVRWKHICYEIIMKPSLLKMGAAVH